MGARKKRDTELERGGGGVENGRKRQRETFIERMGVFNMADRQIAKMKWFRNNSRIVKKIIIIFFIIDHTGRFYRSLVRQLI